MPEAHPSWCARSHVGRQHTAATHLMNRWAAPGRGTTVDLVDVGAHGEVEAAIRVLFDGERLAQLFTPDRGARAGACLDVVGRQSRGRLTGLKSRLGP
jgi:hypothetical protein